jgi:hypothetical protein
VDNEIDEDGIQDTGQHNQFRNIAADMIILFFSGCQQPVQEIQKWQNQEE